MYHCINTIQPALYQGELTCQKLVAHYLSAIERGINHNAFIEIFKKEAVERAKTIDKKIENRTANHLAGMVVALKDNICYKGHIASAGSRMLQNHKAVYHATAVHRLLNADAIFLGRLNCDEFAMGSSNETSYYGAVLNPHDKNRVAGGSSGGSATAVVTGMCTAALGSDTGGSVRNPASYCGIIGLKPTFGRISRYGLIAYASSFDQIGILAQTIDTTAAMLQTIAGKDPLDSTTTNKPVINYPKETSVAYIPKQVAGIKQCLQNKALDPEIKAKTQHILRHLTQNQCRVSTINFSLAEYLVPTYYIIATAQASSNLARYDGMRYGFRSKATNLQDTYIQSRTKAFGKEVKRRILAGTFVLSEGCYRAYYHKALKMRKIITDTTKQMFTNHEFIILPTTPTTAFKLGEKDNNPLQMYLEDIFTVHANLTGIPAISIPIGKHSNGLPFGIQIYAPHFHEAQLLQFARYLMQTCNDNQ